MYALLLFASYLMAANAMQLRAVPPAPQEIRPIKIAGTVRASESSFEMRNVGVQVYTPRKTYTDIAYGIRSTSHTDFYVDSETEFNENIVVEVTAPGFKPLFSFVSPSEVHMLKTLDFKLELADNRHLITQLFPLTSQLQWSFQGDAVKVSFPVGLSVKKASDGSKPEGEVIAAVRVMKPVNTGDEFSAFYKELGPSEALPAEIVVNVQLTDAANNLLKPEYTAEKIKLEIETSETKASDVVVKEAAASGKWSALTGLTSSISNGYFKVDIADHRVNQWHLYKI